MLTDTITNSEPEEAVAKFDSYTFFDKEGGLIRTGTRAHTHTHTYLSAPLPSFCLVALDVLRLPLFSRLAQRGL